MHDPADLTPEVMYQALQHYIFDQLEGGGRVRHGRPAAAIARIWRSFMV